MAQPLPKAGVPAVFEGINQNLQSSKLMNNFSHRPVL